MGLYRGAPKQIGSGRKLGTPNRVSLALMEMLHDLGFDPAVELIEIFANASNTLEEPMTHEDRARYLAIAQKSASELMRYYYPQRKALEVSNSDGTPIMQTIADVMSAVALRRDAAK